jgi:hypothetical protein
MSIYITIIIAILILDYQCSVLCFLIDFKISILLAKRTPAYITHKTILTQAPLAKNVTTPKSAPADEGLSLFAVTNNAGEEANNE